MSNNLKVYSEYNTVEERLEVVKDLHFNQSKSINEIAKLLKINANKIRRDGKKAGIVFMSRGEMLKKMYEVGSIAKNTGPLSEETKQKIAEGVSKSWKGASDERKKKVGQNLDKVERNAAFEKKRVDGILKAAKVGSKLEIFLKGKLVEAGYFVEFHKEHLLRREKLHIDILLPKIKVAIEVDGPTHSQVVYNQETLTKNQIRDNSKTGLLLLDGYVVIRIPQLKKLSNLEQSKIADLLLNKLEDIKANFPIESDRIITLELK